MVKIVKNTIVETSKDIINKIIFIGVSSVLTILMFFCVLFYIFLCVFVLIVGSFKQFNSYINKILIYRFK